LFPHFLDYIYHGSFEDTINTDTAVGLAFLAEYFLQPKFLVCLQAFIQKDLTLKTLERYYTDAVSYDHHTILNWVAQICAKEFEKMAEASGLLSSISPDFFLLVLSMISPPALTEVSSQHSVVVANYSMIHKKAFSLELFYRLTSIDLFPAMEASAALKLLVVEAELRMGEVEVENNATKEESLTCLQKRCVESLAENWEGFTSTMTASLDNIPASVLRKLLLLSMERAKKRVNSLTSRKRKLYLCRRKMGRCCNNIQGTVEIALQQGWGSWGHQKLDLEMCLLDDTWKALDTELRK
jgi:hypothetical protein